MRSFLLADLLKKCVNVVLQVYYRIHVRTRQRNRWVKTDNKQRRPLYNASRNYATIKRCLILDYSVWLNKIYISTCCDCCHIPLTLNAFSIVNFSRIVPNGLLVFFPSYPVMNKCLEHWQVSNAFLFWNWTDIEENKLFLEPMRIGRLLSQSGYRELILLASLFPAFAAVWRLVNCHVTELSVIQNETPYQWCNILFCHCCHITERCALFKLKLPYSDGGCNVVH